MQIDVKKENDVVVVAVEGDLDINTSPDLRDKFEELIGQGENQYVIDLAGVPFMDSSGIAALVSLYKRVRIGAGDVKLCSIQAEVLKIFELTRLNRVFQIFDSRADAVATAAPASPKPGTGPVPKTNAAATSTFQTFMIRVMLMGVCVSPEPRMMPLSTTIGKPSNDVKRITRMYMVPKAMARSLAPMSSSIKLARGQIMRVVTAANKIASKMDCAAIRRARS